MNERLQSRTPAVEKLTGVNRFKPHRTLRIANERVSELKILNKCKRRKRAKGVFGRRDRTANWQRFRYGGAIAV